MVVARVPQHKLSLDVLLTRFTALTIVVKCMRMCMYMCSAGGHRAIPIQFPFATRKTQSPLIFLGPFVHLEVFTQARYSADLFNSRHTSHVPSFFPTGDVALGPKKAFVMGAT